MRINDNMKTKDERVYSESAKLGALGNNDNRLVYDGEAYQAAINMTAFLQLNVIKNELMNHEYLAALCL